MAEPVAETPRVSFDQQVCDEIKAAFEGIFLRHPEVKALSCSIVWEGQLNDAAIAHGVWVGNDGKRVQTGAGVLGSMHQTLRLLEEQVRRAEEFRVNLLAEIKTLSNEVIDGKKAQQQTDPKR
jgi:hypothetical protein